MLDIKEGMSIDDFIIKSDTSGGPLKSGDNKPMGRNGNVIKKYV